MNVPKSTTFLIALLFLVISFVGITAYIVSRNSHTNTPPVTQQTTQSNVTFIGNPSVVENLKASMNTGDLEINSIKTTCVQIKPGCEEAFRKRETKKSYFDPVWNEMTAEEQACLATGCEKWYYPGADVVTETQTVTLTYEQIATLINFYKPPSVLTSDITLQYKDGQIYAETDSSYPFVSGKIHATVEIQSGWFDITQISLNGTSVPAALLEQIDNHVGDRFRDYLGKMYVQIEIISADDTNVTMSIESPKGLFKKEGETLVVDNTIYNQLLKNAPTESSQNGDQMILQ